MIRTGQARRDDGFTLVEILVALVAGAVLAVTCGTMLFHGYREWEAGHRSVAVQRDATAAMELMEHVFREAAVADVIVAASGITVVRASTTATFSVIGQDLVFDPDTATAGDEQTLIAGRVVSFVPTAYTEGIGIFLNLAEGDASIQMDTILTYRNET